MARRLPRPLHRRDILYGEDTPTETLVEFAEAYFEKSLVCDAADFFARAHDRDGLSRVRRFALETGDAFLMRSVQEAEGSLVSKSDWEELAGRAREIGKETYAARGDAGGTPPAPPLQEEALIDEERERGEGAGEGGEGAEGAEGGKPGKEGERAAAEATPRGGGATRRRKLLRGKSAGGGASSGASSRGRGAKRRGGKGRRRERRDERQGG